jgi:AraC-like DNA-binding protein
MHSAPNTDGAWSDAFTVESPRMIVPLRGAFNFVQGNCRAHCAALSALILDASAPYRMRRSASPQVVSVVFIPNESDAATSVQRFSFQQALRLRTLLYGHQIGNADSHPGKQLAFEELFASLNIDEKITSVEPKMRSTSRMSRAVFAAQEFLTENATRKLTLSEIAQAAHASPFHLARAFRANVGATMYQTQLQLRILEAINCIEDGTENLSSLAHQLGFSSHAHFTKVFRQFTAVAPSKYLQH